MKRRGFMTAKNRLWSHIANRKGFTLVELLVTFALLGMLLASVAACLPSIMKVYTSMQELSHQKTICTSVSNQIQATIHGTLGVENAEDELGIKPGNGIGYIALVDSSGSQVALSNSGGAVKPLSSLTGNTLEFVYRDGIIGQMDVNGFDGYTLRKKKFREDYHTQAITGGALMMRYYQMDGDFSQKLTQVDYKAADHLYSVADSAGFSLGDGMVDVAYAIEYPYAEPFYAGYELKANFTIKPEACYIAGEGTVDSPQRTYVNYVNYTLSLWKDGHLKYSQDYVVNVQNAVAYLGSEAAEKPTPIGPVKPPSGFTDGDTYIEPGSLNYVREYGEGLTRQGVYDFKIHIGPSIGLNNVNDYWEISIPKGLHLQGAWYSDAYGSDVYYSPTFSMIVDKENNKIKLSLQGGIGFLNMSEFWIRFQVSSDDGKLFDERMDAMDGVSALDMEQKIPLANSSNANISVNLYNNDKHVEVHIQPTVDQTKSYVKLVYDSEVEAANAMYNTTNLFTVVDGKVVYVYARAVTKDDTDKIDLEPTFKSEGNHKLVSVTVGDTQVYP